MKYNVRQIGDKGIRFEIEKPSDDNTNAFCFTSAWGRYVVTSIDLPVEEWEKIIKKLIKAVKKVKCSQ